MSLDEKPKDQDKNPLGQCRTERHREEESCNQNQNAHAVFIGAGARKTSAIGEDFPERRAADALRRDACPDALTGLHQDTGTHQAFDDTRGRFGGDLKGVFQSLDRDEGRAAMDNFFENGPDDLGSPSGIATVQLHNASLHSWGDCR